MQWPGSLLFLFNEYRGLLLQVLVIHLGGNNLGLVKGKVLVVQVIEDLKAICAR